MCVASSTKTSLFIHTFGVLVYCYGTYYDYYYRDTRLLSSGFGGRLRFLTSISLYLSFISSTFAMFVDLIHVCGVKQKKPSLLIRIRDELMGTWVFTLCSFVSIMYWGIAAVYLPGIHNERIEKVNPLWGWFNHYLHSFPIFYAFTLISFARYKFRPLRNIMVTMIVFVALYLSWLALCAKINGVWAYPILEHLSRVGFVIFTAVASCLLMFVHIIGRTIALKDVGDESKKAE